MLCAPLLLLLLGGPGRPAWAQLPAEDATWLEERLADPLDLHEAGVDELARLPWVDLHLARSIVGLRGLGGLNELGDLLQVPGLGRERLEAMRPFVTLPPRAAAGHEGWARVRSGWAAAGAGSPDAVHALDLEHSGVRASSRQHRGAPPAAWLRWGSGGPASVWAGDLVPVAAAPLAWSGSSPGSRTGRVPGGSAGQPRGRLRAPAAGGWRGVAALARLGPLRAGGGARLAGSGPRAWVQASARAARREFGLVANASGHAGAWLALEGSRLDLGWGGGAVRAGGRWRLRRGGWTAGLAAATAPAGGGGDDPVTGQALDRPHHSWQLDLAAAFPGWRGELLCRRVWRGHPGPAVPTGVQRVELQLRAVGFPAEARVRVDEGLAGPEPASFRSQWALGPFPASGGEWRFALRRGSGAGSAPELWSATLDLPGRSGDWQFRCALARGDRSQAWGTGAGGVGPLVRWLRPGEGGLATRWHAGREGLELQLWSGLRGGAGRPWRAWGGLSFRWTGRWCKGC